jgi:hypothetical protein
VLLLELAGMKKLLAVATLLLLSFPLFSVDDSVSGLTDGVFSDAALGFRYTLPKRLIDETQYSREELRKRAAALGTSNNTLEILLRMTSGPPDTAPDWQAISIQTYSHSKFAGLDDRAVEAKMNGWMAGDGVTAIGEPKRVPIAGQNFVVTNFEKSEPSHVKYARIYSTIRNGKLLGFAFTANSVDKLQSLADSLETLEFTGGAHGVLKDGVFSDADLSFRYAPPKDFRDETSDARELVRTKAAALHTNNTFKVLLKVTSAPDDTALDWRSISIETYPRSKFAGLTNAAAETKINLWAAGSRASAVGDPKLVAIAGASFMVSNFEQSEPPLTKQGRVFSTIRNGQLLVIALTANSDEGVKSLEPSLQTLQFTEAGK